MILPFWGELFKSQTDPEKIEEAIERLIQAHNEDPDAHLGPGGSLYSHKASEVIDHLAESIIEDKIRHKIITATRIHSSGLVADAIVAPEGGDYVSVQDALNAGAKIIYIKKGTYIINSPINIRASNVKIIGESKDHVIFLPAVGYTDPCFIVGSLDPEEPDDITEDIRDIELANFTIGSSSNKFRAGIGFENNEYATWVFNNINVHDINFYIEGWFCVAIGRGADFFVYNNNIFDYNGTVAIYSDAGGTAYIFNNKFYNAKNGVMISLGSWGYPGVPFYVFHNTIYFSNESTTGTGIIISSNGVVVKNNHIFNCRYRGVWIANAYPYPGGVLFEGNFIHMYTGQYAVYINITTYTRVVNNFIIGATNVYGIYTVNFNRSLAIGNHIYNCAYGIYFYASYFTSLIANHIINCTYGLYVTFCDSVYIRLNWLRDNQYPYIEISSIVFKAASTANDNVI